MNELSAEFTNKRSAREAWLTVALALSLLTIAGLVAVNWMRLVPYETAWGNIGTWAQALFTAGGLVFAGMTIRFAAAQLREGRKASSRRIEEERQASRNGIVLRSEWSEAFNPKSKSIELFYRYEGRNTSGTPATNCKINVHMLTEENADSYPDGGSSSDDFYQSIAIGTLLPGEYVRGELFVTNSSAVGLLGNDRFANPDFQFTDVWGQSWLRPGTTHFRPTTPEEIYNVEACMCCGTPPSERGTVRG